MAGKTRAPDDVYGTLNCAWKSTCRAVLAGEVGELKKYEAWLLENMAPMLHRKSAFSGKGVSCAVPDYAKKARFLSLDEIGVGEKPEPLGINQIKDIDSILEALRERPAFAYCGNFVLGNSSRVADSSGVQNSSGVLKSNFIYGCEYAAFSSYCRGSRYIFGVVSDLECSSLIKVYETLHQARCLEAWSCYNSSDCYFSSCVVGSTNAMFSFNLRNKRNVIGNLELPKERYLQLKTKLLGEIREELERNGRLPSLIEIARSGEPPDAISLQPEPAAEEENDLEPVEAAFQKTTSVLLGRPLKGIRSYENWLMRHVPGIEKARSAVSGRPVYVSLITPTSLFPRDRLLGGDECWKAGEAGRLEPHNLVSFTRLKETVGRIAYFGPEWRLGECKNLMGVPFANTSRNCYRCGIASFCNDVACSYWPRKSRYVFGSAVAFHSEFCMNAYYSDTVSRAFEVDGCNNCSDVYFTHNCENARDAMFCFNTKNLRMAIGNTPLEAGQYRKVKSSLLGQIADELESRKALRWDVFGMCAPAEQACGGEKPLYSGSTKACQEGINEQGGCLWK